MRWEEEERRRRTEREMKEKGRDVGRGGRREQRREFKNYIGSKAFIIHVFTMPQQVK